MILELVFLPAILLLGIITSYQDVKYGKIKNKWIVFALVYAVVGYVLLVFYYWIIGGFRIQYFIEFGINFIFVVVVGFGLYMGKIWSEGDGKLFIAYGTLIPLSSYSLGYVKWFPSFTLLTNIFLIGFLALIFIILIKTNIKDSEKTLIGFIREFFNLKNLSESLVYIFSILWVVQSFLAIIKLQGTFILTMIFTILIASIIKAKLKKKYVNFMIIMIVIAILRFFLDKSIYSLEFLINFIILLIVFGIIKSFSSGSLYKFSKKIFSKENETMPFAPFMFAGVLLNLIARGNFIPYIRAFLLL